MSLGRSICCAALLFTVGPVLAQDDEPPAPREAVSYVEWQLRSDASQDGRRFGSRPGGYYGIDINSSVEIKVVSSELTRAVLSDLPEGELTQSQSDILSLLAALNGAVASIEPAMNALQTVFELWGQASASDDGDYTDFLVAVRGSNRTMFSLLNTLKAAIVARLVADGRSDSAADDEADEIMAAVLSGGNFVLGYDWDALRRIYTEELQFAEARLAAIADEEGLELEIHGHLITDGQTGVPIFLEGYNEVTTGPSTIYRKIRYEIPPEVIELRDEYKEVAKQLDDARSLGEALQLSLEAEFERNKAQIEGMLSGVTAAVDEAGMAFENLKEWTDAEKRRQWIADVRARITLSADGQAVVAAWEDVQEVFDSVEEDIEALQAYAKLGVELRRATTPEQALGFIMGTFRDVDALARSENAASLPAGIRVLRPETWETRAAALTTFLESLEPLSDTVLAEITGEDSPVEDLRQLQQAAENLFQAIEDTAENARATFFSFSSHEPIEFAAELPTPVGQVRLGLSPDTNLDTAFDLKTVSQARQPDNEVWISYKFFRGGEEISTIGWRDRFLVRVFGWQDHVTAGLAFASQQSGDTWEPTASLSWLLHKRRWPKDDADNGLRGLGEPQWFSGFGLSTMPLDFDEENDVEIGIAATASFFDDWVLAGYGVNLQAEDDEAFWFISLRLFRNQGAIGGAQ